jgi:hypothetical protein
MALAAELWPARDGVAKRRTQHMKSLIKKSKKQDPKAAPAKNAAEPKVAQCCAKVSKAVAGCHD